MSITKQRSDARANILAKLKEQVEGSDYSKLPNEPCFSYPETTREMQIEQFVTHLTNNHAQVIDTSLTKLPQTIEEVLSLQGITKLLYGEGSPYSSVVKQLTQEIEISPFNFEIDQHKDQLFNHTPASITSSHAAIAATGSIVLWPTEHEPRTLSLVPPVHLVVVDANTLYCDFATLTKEQRWHEGLPTNVLLISGPSKTADIKQTLAYGAHGPEKLFVLLINR